MTIEVCDHSIIYNDGSDFFKLGGNNIMKLTPKAAKEVCVEATNRKVFIGRIEGGHWMNPGFRPDMNTFWDSKTDLESAGDFKANNELAIQNINDDESEGYNAFIITIVGLTA